MCSLMQKNREAERTLSTSSSRPQASRLSMLQTAQDQNSGVRSLMQMQQMLNQSPLTLARANPLYSAPIQRMEDPSRGREQTGQKPGKEEGPQIIPSGLVLPRIAEYHTWVKKFEQLPPDQRDDPKKIVKRMYQASKNVLLPELKDIYPPLVIDEGGDDAEFSRSKWVLTIPVSDELAEGKGTDLADLSTTVLHETRHLEQAWFEAVIKSRPRRGFRSKTPTQLAGEVEIPVDVFKKLVKIPIPGRTNVDFMDPILQTSKKEKSAHAARMSRLADLRFRDRIDPELLKDLGQEPLTAEENIEMGQLMEQYKAYPREADAFMAEDAYKAFYQEQGGE